MSDTSTTSTKSPTISVIIPVHENEGLIDECLSKLNQQTTQPSQIIVFGCCMDRYIYPHHKDWGADMCQAGLDISTSDFTWFLNADDVPSDNFIERLLQEDADIIACDFTSRNTNGICEVSPQVGTITRGCFIVKTDVAKRIGYNDRSYNADGIFAQEIAKNGTFIRVPELLYEHK